MNNKKKISNKTARTQFVHYYGARLRSQISVRVREANAALQPERCTSLKAAITVANRDLAFTTKSQSEARVFSALRAVNAHIGLVAHNRQTTAALRNADLLPIGHPASTRSHAMTASAKRHARAQWIAADAAINDSVRGLVASAHAALPGSAARDHAFLRLSLSNVPAYVAIDPLSTDIDLSPIIAVGGFGLGGNSSAARSLRAKMQRRDRYGRFAFMGGGFSFNLHLPSGLFKTQTGRVVGASGENDIEIEIASSSALPDGIYAFPSSKGESFKAVIRRDLLKKIPGIKDSQTRGDGVFVESSDIKFRDAPTGWTEIGKSGNTTSYSSEDGYFVQKTIGAPGTRPLYTLHRANLANNSRGAEISRGSSWADVQKAAKKDAPKYEKVLRNADALKKSGKWEPSGAADEPDLAALYDTVRDEMQSEGWKKTDYGYKKEFKKRAAKLHPSAIAVRDQMLAEGWEKTDKNFQTEFEDRIDALPRPSKWSKNPVAKISSDQSNALGKLWDWATGPGSSNPDVKRLVDKRKFGDLPSTSWDFLTKKAAADPSFATFDGMPADMTPDEKAALREFVDKIAPNEHITAYNPEYGGFPNNETEKYFHPLERVLSKLAQGDYVSVRDWNDIRDLQSAMSIPGRETFVSRTLDVNGKKFYFDGIKNYLDAKFRIVDGERTDRVISDADEIVDQADAFLDQADDAPFATRFREYMLEAAASRADIASQILDHFDATPEERKKLEQFAADLELVRNAKETDVFDLPPTAKPEAAGTPREPKQPKIAEIPGEVPSTPEIRDIVGKTSEEKIAEIEKAIADGAQIRFDYSGKERTITPSSVSLNEKTKNVNVVGVDQDGAKKSYTVEKIVEKDAPTAPVEPAIPMANARDEVVASVASKLHDEWRASRKKDDGTYEPRMKDDGKGGEVDIANTDYVDLPPKWQDENKKSAESALQAILDNPEGDIEELADAVHEQWLERNGEWAPPEQKLPYAELSEEEKQKDRDVVDAALAEAKKAGLVESAKPGRSDTKIGPGADLYEENLEGEDLTGENLTEANLRYANLTDADLYEANLDGADLTAADLEGASFRLAELEGALLNDVEAVGADFTSANLKDAELRKANLTNVLAQDANLTGADLTGANLDGADLGGADLTGANLDGATGKVIGTPKAMPDGWSIVDQQFVKDAEPDRKPGEPIELIGGSEAELRSQLEDAITNKSTVKFNYSGKERIFSPERIQTTASGNVNVIGYSHNDDASRTFTISKIEVPPAPVEDIAVDDAAVNKFEAAFDSVMDTPDGAYKVDIFSDYVPTGRTTQDSADFTDDPVILSTKIPAMELVEALRQAVLPDEDGTPASGYGSIGFDSGPELVRAEAIYEALHETGLSADMILGGMYDKMLDPDRDLTNTERISGIFQKGVAKPESNQFRNEIPVTQDGLDNLRSPGTSAPQPPLPPRVQGVVNFVSDLNDFVETNETIEYVAEVLQDYQDDENTLGSGDEIIDVGLETTQAKFFKLAYKQHTSGDPAKQEAFAAAWGALLALDGGDGPGLEQSGWRYNGVMKPLLEINGGDQDAAEAAYEEIIDKYGDFEDFQKQRNGLLDGSIKLDSPEAGTAGAFYRLAKAASRPNESTLHRVVEVDADDAMRIQAYTTEGSKFSFDPRSWTTKDFANGEWMAQMTSFKAVKNKPKQRFVFEALAGDISSISVETISSFNTEREHLAYGDVEVVSVRTNSMQNGSGIEYVVQVRQVQKPSKSDEAQATPEAANEPPQPPSKGPRTFTGVESWEKIGAQGGSNQGGFYEDPSGNQYYVKVPKSESHAQNEVLASLFYAETGIPAAEMAFGDSDGDLRIVSPLVPGADGYDFEMRVSEKPDQAYIEQAREGFVVDAWLANWDSVGLSFDNMVSDADGRPVRLDPGGSLMYRAQGAPKGGAFGDVVGELDTLRNRDTNYSAGTVFGDISEAQLRSGAERVRDISPSRIDEMVDSVVTNTDDAALIKARLKARRQYIINRFNLPEGIEDSTLFPEPVPLTEALGFAAQDLQPGDITASDSFVIEKVFRDETTPKGKVSIQGYYPGHESQRKEWNEATNIEAARGSTLPPKGDKPALHRPQAPKKLKSGGFTGQMEEMLSGVDNWQEAASVIRGSDMVFFDYETTGLPDAEAGITNDPVQLGAVRVRDGKVVDRFNVYMNPGSPLSEWSAAKLKDPNGNLITEEWLAQQISAADAHQQFIEFAGESPILGGQNVPFDLEVLQRTLGTHGLELDVAGTIDSMDFAGSTLPKWTKASPDGPFTEDANTGKIRASKALGPVADYLNVGLGDGWHSADADAEASWNILDAMLTRAVGNPDTPKDLLDEGGRFEARKIDRLEYDAALAQHQDDLAQYVIDKAVAAAFGCGGAGLIASVGPDNGPCSIPSLDDLIKDATADPNQGHDPDGLPQSLIGAEPFDDTLSGGRDIRDPYAGEKFPPTDQQRAIIDAAMSGEDTVVRALAGTGKTSVLQYIARRLKKEKPETRIVYVAFNKGIQEEANSGKFPGNVEARTADSIAWAGVGKDITDKRSTNKSHVFPSDVAKRFGIKGITVNKGTDREEQLSQRETVALVKKGINNFGISADSEIGLQHFPVDNPPQELVDWANMMWEDINDPEGWLPVTNTHVTKMWALTNPDLSEYGAGLSTPADVIFFDEAQDINPVIGKVIADQRGQKIYVGDGNQAIYAFRGAEDELQKVTAVHDLPLTKSWRFGPQVAGIGNRFLTLLKSPYKIEGAGPEGEILNRGDMIDADAVLVRTNAGAIKAIFDELERNRTVGVSANYKDSLESFSSTARWLMDGADPDFKPKNINEDLVQFRTWDEVIKAAKDDDNRKLQLFVDLVDDIGLDGLDEMLAKVKVHKGGEDGKAKPIVYVAPNETASGMGGLVTDTPKGPINFNVSGDTVSISGATFEFKDQIKAAGFNQWDSVNKRWTRNYSSPEERAQAVNRLKSALSGDDQKIDVVVTTAHRAKGLEWDNVKIYDDFWGPRVDKKTGETIMPSDEEMRLAYVAVTRAKKKLDPGTLEWVYGYTSASDESPNAPEAPEAPEAEASELAAELGDEISSPDGEQNSLALRTPDDEILLSLITGGGSTDSGVELNRNWADHLEQYTEGDGPADESIKTVTDLLASLSSRELRIDVDEEDVLNELIDSKLLKVVEPNAENPDGTYEASPILTNILHGIAGFTSGIFFSTKDEEQAKEAIGRMEGWGFFGDGGGYLEEAPTAYGADPPERSVKEFWKNFATILSNPKVLSQPGPEDSDLLASAAGMLLRALRVASPVEGTFTRVLHFMEDIEDESHPLHYMLNVGQEVQLRPSSWMYDEGKDIADLAVGKDGLFKHGGFGTQEGALGDVLFTVTNPRGLDARPLPNTYGEAETILSGGRYKVTKIEKREIGGSPYTHFTLEDVSREKASEAPTASDIVSTPEFQAEVLNRLRDTPEFADFAKAQDAVDNEIAVSGKRVPGSVIDLAEIEARNAFNAKRKEIVDGMVNSGWSPNAPEAPVDTAPKAPSADQTSGALHRYAVEFDLDDLDDYEDPEGSLQRYIDGAPLPESAKYEGILEVTSDKVRFIVSSPNKLEDDQELSDWTGSYVDELEYYKGLPADQTSGAPIAPEAPTAIDPATRKAELDKYELVDQGEGEWDAKDNDNSYLREDYDGKWNVTVDGKNVGKANSLKEAQDLYNQKAEEAVDKKLAEQSISVGPEEQQDIPLPGETGTSAAPDTAESSGDLPAIGSPAFLADLAEAVADMNNTLTFLTGTLNEKKPFKDLIAMGLSIAERHQKGQITFEEAASEIRDLQVAKQALPSKGNNTFFTHSTIDSLQRVFADRPIGSGLPPEGSGLGYNKAGIFIVPGMRVRDKWGFAGTVLRYNHADFVNVFIINDIDGRDPSTVKPHLWGPGRYTTSKNPKFLTVLQEGDDDSPWIDNGKVPASKKPHNLEDQLKAIAQAKSKGKGDGEGEGDGSVGVPEPSPEPDSGGDGGNLGEPKAGTTEDLRQNVEEQNKQEAWTGEEDKREEPKSKVNTSKSEPWLRPGADLSGMDLTDTPDLDGIDLSYANLNGANLSGADLTGTTLSSAELRKADLNGAILNSADLSGAQLTDADLSRAELNKANLRNADLSDTTVWNADMIGADLRNANLSGAQLYNVDFSGANLIAANLSYANMNNANLEGADLTLANLEGVIGTKIKGTPKALPEGWSLVDGSFVESTAPAPEVEPGKKKKSVAPQEMVPGADLSGRDFTGDDLTNVNMNNANLSGSDLSDADLSNANLSYANLTKADLRSAILIRTDLMSANLKGAKLKGAQLEKANLTIADLNDASLVDAELMNANLAYADLTNANLFGADLTGAYLSGANLSGVELTGANLEGADLTGANLTGVSGAMIMGTPKALPNGWVLENGILIEVPSGPSADSPTPSKPSTPKMTLEQENIIGPRVVGGTYHSGQWDADYEVVDITLLPDGYATYTAKWLSKYGDSTSEHMTPWAPENGDKILTGPGADVPEPSSVPSDSTGLTEAQKTIIGPRVVGGTYHSEYYDADYTVLKIEPMADGNVEITMRWGANREVLSSTKAWSPKDTIVNQPEIPSGVISTEPPTDFSVSPIGGTSSLRDSLDAVRGTAVPQHVSLIDGDDIEDLAVKVSIQQVTSEGSNGLLGDALFRAEMSYKLGIDAGRDLLNQILANPGTWQDTGLPSGIPSREFDYKSGSFTSDSDAFSWEDSPFDTGNVLYSHTDPNGRFRILAQPVDSSVQLGGSDLKMLRTTANTVYIEFSDDEPSDRTIQDAMELAGVRSTAPATSADLERVVNNRLLRVFAGTKYGEILEANRTDRARFLKEIQQTYGVTGADFEARTTSAGFVEIIGPAELADAIIKKTKLNGLTHTLTMPPGWGAGQKKKAVTHIVDTLVDADGTPGGLLSARARFEIGSTHKGQSTPDDLRNGAADYVYLSQIGELDSYFIVDSVMGTSSDVLLAFDHEQVLRRVDIWANEVDRWGSMTAHSDVIGNMNPKGYELMVKHHVSTEDMTAVYTGADMRDAILEELRRRGIDEINGIPASEFIVLAGQGPQSRKAKAVVKAITDFAEPLADDVPTASEYLAAVRDANNKPLLNSYDANYLSSNVKMLLFNEKTKEFITYLKWGTATPKVQLHSPGKFGQPDVLTVDDISSLNLDDWSKFGTYGSQGAYQTYTQKESLFESIMEQFKKGTLDRVSARNQVLALLRLDISVSLRSDIKSVLYDLDDPVSLA